MSGQINQSSYSDEELEEMRQDESKLIRISAFDIARIGKDQLYAMVEENMGYTHDIISMKLHPVAFDDEEVCYYVEIIDATEN